MVDGKRDVSEQRLVSEIRRRVRLWKLAGSPRKR